MAYKKSTAPEFYKLKSHPGTKNFTIQKFDEDLDCISSYPLIYHEAANSHYYDCGCPAAKFDCRHKAIMKEILDDGMVDSEKFFCHQAPASKQHLQGLFVNATEI